MFIRIVYHTDYFLLEKICLYESMLVGQRHLLDSGYVKTATGEEEGNDESKLSIEEQLAPWITTRNFINATQVSLNISRT